jgi:hypothetical protein
MPDPRAREITSTGTLGESLGDRVGTEPAPGDLPRPPANPSPELEAQPSASIALACDTSRASSATAPPPRPSKPLGSPPSRPISATSTSPPGGVAPISSGPPRPGSPAPRCQFVARHEVVLLVGATGVGKGHLAQARGHRAVRRGHTVLYTSATRWGTMIVSSNRALPEWPPLFNDPLLASAAMDRLLHHADVVEIEGESYRSSRRKPVGEATA